MKTPRTRVTMTGSVPLDIHEDAKRAANAAGVSLSGWVRSAIEARLGRGETVTVDQAATQPAKVGCTAVAIVVGLWATPDGGAFAVGKYCPTCDRWDLLKVTQWEAEQQADGLRSFAMRFRRTDDLVYLQSQVHRDNEEQLDRWEHAAKKAGAVWCEPHPLGRFATSGWNKSNFGGFRCKHPKQYLAIQLSQHPRLPRTADIPEPARRTRAAGVDATEGVTINLDSHVKAMARRNKALERKIERLEAGDGREAFASRCEQLSKQLEASRDVCRKLHEDLTERDAAIQDLHERLSRARTEMPKRTIQPVEISTADDDDRVADDGLLIDAMPGYDRLETANEQLTRALEATSEVVRALVMGSIVSGRAQGAS